MLIIINQTLEVIFKIKKKNTCWHKMAFPWFTLPILLKTHWFMLLQQLDGLLQRQFPNFITLHVCYFDNLYFVLTITIYCLFYFDNPIGYVTMTTHWFVTMTTHWFMLVCQPTGLWHSTGLCFYDNPMVYVTMTTHWFMLLWQSTGLCYFDNPLAYDTLLVYVTMISQWFVLLWQPSDLCYYDNPLFYVTKVTHWFMLLWQLTSLCYYDNPLVYDNKLFYVTKIKPTD